MREYLYNLATDKYRGFIAKVIKAFLFILSIIYGLLVRILIFLYGLRPYHLSCKVISVGNITLGGTGKTILVELIAKYLKQRGRKVAILSRGYKRSVPISQSSVPSHKTMGDEPYMLQMKLKDIPVVVDVNRIRAAGTAMRDYSVDTVILDDGLQQWKISKDLEIVTIDATNPFGNRRILPRGILRQPLSSLRCADIFILTKTNLNPDTQVIKDFLKQINPAAPVFESIHSPLGFYKITSCSAPLLKIDALKGKTVTLFSGIGDPDSFENLIISLGINIGLSFRFPDHHIYSQKDLENIVVESQKKNIDTVVTTEKDAVRFSSLVAAHCSLLFLVLCIELKITENEQRFYNRLLRLYSI